VLSRLACRGLQVTKKNKDRKKGFGGATRESFDYYLYDAPGRDSPSPDRYEVPPVLVPPKTHYTSLMQYVSWSLLSGRLLRF
jgi:hypothetical protein